MADPKTTWGAGEYTLMAQALEPVSAKLVDAARVSAGDRVIDVGTGTGNAAVRASTAGASVTAIDFEPSLLALAEERAERAGVDVDFIEGEVEALPVGDGEADVVLSAFGVMYALDHVAAARELVRVLAPSGRIALAAWVPGSLMPAMGGVTAEYLPPPPPASGPPSRWGDPESLDGLLADAGAKLRMTRCDQLSLPFQHAHDAVNFLIRTAGHIVSERERLIGAARWVALRDDLATCVEQHSDDRPEGLVLQLDYLIAVAEPA